MTENATFALENLLATKLYFNILMCNFIQKFTLRHCHILILKFVQLKLIDIEQLVVDSQSEY